MPNLIYSFANSWQIVLGPDLWFTVWLFFFAIVWTFRPLKIILIGKNKLVMGGWKTARLVALAHSVKSRVWREIKNLYLLIHSTFHSRNCSVQFYMHLSVLRKLRKRFNNPLLFITDHENHYWLPIDYFSGHFWTS